MAVGIYKKVVNEIMTKDLVTIRTKDTVHDALMLMAENRLTALPVIDQAGKCVGIVAQGDIIAVAHEKDVEDDEMSVKSRMSLLYRGVSLDEITDERVEDVMSERILIAAPDEPVTELADKMLAAEVHHVPVVEDGRLLGIASTMDILAALRQPL